MSRKPNKNGVNGGFVGRKLEKNGNYLLNFKYYSPIPSPNRSYRKIKATLNGVSSREQFLQANFFFRLLPKTHPNQSCFYFPDSVIDWDCVESVIIPLSIKDSSSSTVKNEEMDYENSISNSNVSYRHQMEEENGWKCPICLERPTCPRVSRCGHGPFCLVCILRHLEKEYMRRCPMCFDNISRDLLAPATMMSSFLPSKENPISFTLLSRAKDELVPCNIEMNGQTDDLRCPDEDSKEAKFARLTIATPESMVKKIELEKTELDEFRKKCFQSGDVEWITYVTEAQELVNDRIKFLETTGNLMTKDHSVSPKEGDEKIQNHPKECFHFYQSEECHLTFLDPLNMSCLKTEYSGENMPLKITGQVVQIQCFRLTEKYRKRHSYLNHLPEHCQITFVEIDINHLLSEKTLLLCEKKLSERRQTQKKISELTRIEKEAEDLRKINEKAARFATIDLYGPKPRELFPGFEALELEEEVAQDRCSKGPPALNMVSGQTESFASILSKTPEKKDEFPALGLKAERSHNQNKKTKKPSKEGPQKVKQPKNKKKEKETILFCNAGLRGS